MIKLQSSNNNNDESYSYHISKLLFFAKHDIIIIYNLLKIQIGIIIRYLMIRIYGNRSILLNVVL